MANGLPGWYPDPGGAPGQFRYWDGQAWSQALSPTPYAAPPTTNGFDPRQPITPAGPSALGPGVGGTFGGLGGPAGTAVGAAPGFSTVPPKRKPPVATLVVGAVVVVALALVGVVVVPRLIRGNPGGGGQPTTPVATDPADQVCPKITGTTPPRARHPDDGWIHGGMLAFPAMPSSRWNLDTSEFRVPFGRDVALQSFSLHPLFDGVHDWVASVLVAELYAGDGFYAPQEGAEIVTKCVIGSFYSDSVVTRQDSRNEAMTLDGKDGWVIQTKLSFSIPNVPTTSEDVTIMVIATGNSTSSLFYSSVPTDSPPEVISDVQAATQALKVSP